MERPVLVIMAAGMGSRFGGLKQIEPVDDAGHIIMDYSIYDAYEAGFRKVIFIIKEENEQLFRECIGDRIAKKMEVEYVFQKTDNIPEGFTVPEGRVKPWGTGHAVLSCYGRIDGPFAAINADDYYGASAFHQIYDYLAEHEDDGKYRYAMVGYRLKNTVTENGSVARGICHTDEEGHLTDIVETLGIEVRDGQIVSPDGDGFAVHEPDTVVSMNMWGFTNSMLEELKTRFVTFLEEKGGELKSEYYLPFVANELVEEGKAVVQVLESEDKWYGVTYKEDKPMVVNGLRKLVEEGNYNF